MKASKKILIGIILVIIAGIYYYIALPAANLHSSEAWFFLLFFLAAVAVIYALRKKLGKRSEAVESHEGFSLYDSGCGDYLPGWKPFILSDY